MSLDRKAQEAIDKHERLLHLKTLELLLGSMIRRSGIADVRRLLQHHLDHLAEFES